MQIKQSITDAMKPDEQVGIFSHMVVNSQFFLLMTIPGNIVCSKTLNIDYWMVWETLKQQNINLLKGLNDNVDCPFKCVMQI